MQHISPSWHCGRNTRRGPSHRLKNNLLCLAALLLFALMTSLGWAQTRVSVTDAIELCNALEQEGNVIIEIANNISTLDYGHTTKYNTVPPTPGTIHFNKFIEVAKGKKIIYGNGRTINRGNYANNSIVLRRDASLEIYNLTFDGQNVENYASMILVNESVELGKLGDPSYSAVEVTNGQLKMKNCTIKNCKLKKLTDEEFSEFKEDQIDINNGLVHNTGQLYLFSAITNSGGAGVCFGPGYNATSAANNTILLEKCTFDGNEVISNSVNMPEVFLTEIGGALAIARKAASGTIKGGTFTKNKAPKSGGAIAFHQSLTLANNEFYFDSINTIGGYGNKNTAGVDGGGIYIEGGKVFICGQTTISYNEAEVELC